MGDLLDARARFTERRARVSDDAGQIREWLDDLSTWPPAFERAIRSTLLHWLESADPPRHRVRSIRELRAGCRETAAEAARLYRGKIRFPGYGIRDKAERLRMARREGLPKRFVSARKAPLRAAKESLLWVMWMRGLKRFPAGGIAGLERVTDERASAGEAGA